MASSQYAGPPILQGPGGVAYLTPRQLEVLELAACGLRYKQIAKCLGISRRTVEDRFREMQERAGTKTRDELLVYAVKAGLVQPGDNNSFRDCNEPGSSIESKRPAGGKQWLAATHQPATQRSVDEEADLIVTNACKDRTECHALAERVGLAPIESVLAALCQVAAERDRLDRVERTLIDTARDRRVTWSQIGRALGLRSAQAAQQRRKRLALIGLTLLILLP